MTALVTALLVTCMLTLAALVADPRHPLRVWTAAVACAAVAAGIAWRLRPRAAAPLQVAIDGGGLPLLRATAGVAGTDVPLPARCVFVAPWLITLRRGALRAPVWPDALPAEAFRRLHACVRWGSPAPDAVADAADPQK